MISEIFPRSNMKTTVIVDPFRIYFHVLECEHDVMQHNLSSIGLLQTGDEDSSDDEDETPEDPMLMDISAFFPTPVVSSPAIAHLPPELDEWDTYLGKDEDEPTEGGFSLKNVDVNLVESVLLCIRQIFRARDAEDFTIAIVQFLKSYTGKSACAMIAEVVSKVKGILFSGVGEQQTDDGHLNIFSKLRQLVSKAHACTKHPLLDKFRKILMYTISFATMTKIGYGIDEFFYSKAEAEALQKEYSSKTGFLASIFDAVTSLLERLVDCYHTGTWSPLIAGGHTYAAWSDSVYDIKAKSQSLHNPDACGFSYHEFLGKLQDAIDKGRAIVKYEKDKTVVVGVKKLLSELEIIQAGEFTKKAARASRDAPFSILYYGGSSLAKSTLQDLTHLHFAKTHDLPPDDEYKYTRIAADEYFSGFMSQMWSIIIDDIANLNPNLGLDPSMGEVLQLRNNAAYCPPQADLADKGKTPVICDLLQASTNTKHLNAHAYYNNPLAILRRWNLVVTVTLKPEYSILIGGVVPEPEKRMLDGAKVPPLTEGEYPDMWEFVVERAVADSKSTREHQIPKFEHLLTTDNIYEYMAFISKVSTEFRAQQKCMRESGATMRKIVLCKTCYRPSTQCACVVGEHQTDVYLGAAAVAATCVTAPAIAKFARRFVRSKHKQLKSAVTDAATDVARGVVRDLTNDAKKMVIPHMVDFLTKEGVINTAQNMSSPEEEEMLNRLLSLNLPSTPKESWLDIIRRKIGDLPGTDRLRMEARWVGIMMRRIGRNSSRVLRKIQRNDIGRLIIHQVVGAFAMIIAITTAAKFSKWIFGDKKKKKGSKQADDVPSTVAGFKTDEQPNPWYKEQFIPAEQDFGPLTVSWKALPREQIIQRVARNTMFVKSLYEQDGKMRGNKFRILALGGQLFVTNKHSIPVETVRFVVTQSTQLTGVSENFSVSLHPGDFWYPSESEDLVFFRIRCIPPRASLEGLLVSRDFRTFCDGVMVTREENGETGTLRVKALHNFVDAPGTSDEVIGFLGECERKTISGECGSPYVGFPPMGPVLLGMHTIGGLTEAVVALHVPIEDVKEARKQLRAELVVPRAFEIPRPRGVKQSMDELHAKSVFRYIEKGTATVYGSHKAHRSGGRSHVSKTYIYDDIVDLGYEDKFAAPELNHWQPWRQAAVDIMGQQHTVNAQIVDECAQAFLDDILNELPEGALDEVRILTVDEAVNGLPGVKYIDRMNLNSSMGFPWNKSKRNFCEDLGEYEHWTNYVKMSEEILDEVEQIRTLYRQGIRSNAVFRAHQKDEVISKLKALTMKTRIFAGGSGPLGIVMRQYYLSLVRVIQKYKTVFEAAPGTNATSVEWCQFYHWLTEFGPEWMIAGDFKYFDKNQDPTFMLAAFWILEQLLERAGIPEEIMVEIRTNKYDICFPVTEFNGDFVCFWGSNPSGQILTVIINCLVNSIYMRYAWRMGGNEVKKFRQFVRLLTYGDDNIMGVNPEFKDLFNHCVIQNELAKIGVIYTMADKTAESVPFLPIDKVSFLKRSWVFNEDVGSFVAQLEHDSIAKSLLRHLPSKTVCDQKLACDSMYCALLEYFMYGRDEFEKRRMQFQAIVERRELSAYATTFPTYDELVEKYLANGSGVAPDGRCRLCDA